MTQHLSPIPPPSRYTAAALVVFNTLLAVLILNLVLGAAFYLWDRQTAPPVETRANSTAAPGQLFAADGSAIDTGHRTKYQLDWFDYGAYGSTPEQQVGEILDDFFDLSQLGFMYQPWVQFAEPPFSGRQVHVDLDIRGFPVRRTENPPPHDPSQPVLTIFTLGGSTTFGYNVADSQTWPTYLSAALNEQARAQGLPFHINIVNYGRGYFYPGQELILAIDLLKNGYRPSAMIFLDGVNIGPADDVPIFSREIKGRFKSKQFTASSTAFTPLQWIPMIRLATAMGSRLNRKPADASIDHVPAPPHTSVSHAVNRFRQTRQLLTRICESYGVTPIFFLQPEAAHGYAHTLFRRPVPESFQREKVWMTEFYAGLAGDSGLTDLSHLFEDWGTDRKAIIDDVHYSPDFHRFLAHAIARHIPLRELTPRALHNDQAATGTPRDSSWHLAQ